MFSGSGQIIEHTAAADAAGDDLSVPDRDSLPMGTLARELDLQRRPSWLLRRFMNALERQRQARGQGTEAQAPYRNALAGHAAWREPPARQSQLPSQRYIDYFGPRRFIPAGTSFD